MPLVNLRYYQQAKFFCDERSGNLEEMVLLPIQSPIEMGQEIPRVVDTLARDTTYPVLFARAFGNREIPERTIGKALFMRNCSTCHMKEGNEHFFVPTLANTGLRPFDPTADAGVADVTLRNLDVGSFKSPSLRNVEVTAPCGHDGRFVTLDAPIDHYSNNPIFDPNLGYMMPVGPLNFTTSEKASLIAFLKTLTDETFLTDPRFANLFADRCSNGSCRSTVMRISEYRAKKRRNVCTASSRAATRMLTRSSTWKRYALSYVPHRRPQPAPAQSHFSLIHPTGCRASFKT